MSILKSASHVTSFKSSNGSFSGIIMDTSTAANTSNQLISIYNTNTTKHLYWDFSAQNFLWLHFMIGQYLVEPDAGHQWVVVENASGNYIAIEGTTNNDTTCAYRLVKWDGATKTTIVTSTEIFSIGKTCDIKIDVQVVGGVEFFINGTSQGSDSGDYSAWAGINTLKLQGQQSKRSRFKDIIIADEDTRGMFLQRMNITANGSETDFTGSYTDIDDLDDTSADYPDDTTFITSSAAADISTFAFADLDSAYDTGFDVIAATVLVSAKKGTDATGTIAPSIKENLTVGNGAFATLTPNVESFDSLFHLNPDTGLAWTIAEINAAEVGVESAA